MYPPAEADSLRDAVPIPPLKLMADHPGTAAHIALGDRPGLGAVQRLEGMLTGDVHSLDVVEAAIPGLRDHRQRPQELVILATYRPVDHRIAHNSNAERVGDHDRTPEKAGFLYPGRSGHLPVAIERPPRGHHRIARPTAARQDGRDPSSHRSLTDHQLALAADQRDMADFHARDIADRVERARGSIEGNAQIACPRFGLRGAPATRTRPTGGGTACAWWQGVKGRYKLHCTGRRRVAEPSTPSRHPMRPRDQILVNLETTYREQYQYASTDSQPRRMMELDAGYQRDQLMLEVLLDIRDLLSTPTSLPRRAAQ